MICPPPNQPSITFTLGTTAELIKVAPVMLEMRRREVVFDVIGTGQHHLPETELFPILGLRERFIQLVDPPDGSGALTFARWCVKAQRAASREFRARATVHPRHRSIVVVHGDTVSTIIGANSAKRAGFRVAHIEAGLRSGNFLKPFPEELDRALTARFADFHFCPYSSAVENLRHAKGQKINTFANTNLDALRWALAQTNANASKIVDNTPFFILIFHRQENLMNLELARLVFDLAIKNSTRMKCVLVAHPNTLATLKKLGLLDKIEANQNVVLMERQPYLSFISLLSKASMIWTDGGGNQQECSYVGIPTLILRDRTESEEGLKRNVVVGGVSEHVISEFFNDYDRYKFPLNMPDLFPSKTIVDTLCGAIRKRGEGSL